MNLIAQVFAIIAVLFHLMAFVLESVLFHRSDVQVLMQGQPAQSQDVHKWAFNQGFYNLFLAAGPVAGLIAYYAGNVEVGRALVIYGCAFMVGCGIVLLISDRTRLRAMLGQSGPPLIALIALLF